MVSFQSTVLTLVVVAASVSALPLTFRDSNVEVSSDYGHRMHGIQSIENRRIGNYNRMTNQMKKIGRNRRYFKNEDEDEDENENEDDENENENGDEDEDEDEDQDEDENENENERRRSNEDE
eukprot:Awhi_evm1s3800